MRPLLLTSLIVFSLNVVGQDSSALPESIEYKRSYRNQTRSRSGMPGERYWQNKSSYSITAEFDPKSKEVKGQLSVEYFNESPDSLESMVFKVMQNIYKKGANRQMATSTVNLHDGVNIYNVVVDQKELGDVTSKISGTVLKLNLPKLLKSGSSCTVEMDFITPIPKGAGLRSGAVDSSSFFIAYWFPQVAVYDDIFGWDTDEYVGVPENYNDISVYNVELTLPSQFNVWATGEHLNKEEIFDRETLNRIEESKSSEESIRILDEDQFRVPDGKSHTWKFQAQQVPDFAFGVSDHYVWEAVMAANPNSSEPCWVQTAYAIGHPNFDEVLDIAKNSIEIFSKDFPGVPYPYFKHITFSGTQGGGMEFPMIANNFATPNPVFAVLVTAHEIAHNYYPFMMGVNERKYSWWDETMTSLMEVYLSETAYPENQIRGFFDRKTSFPYYGSGHEILPLMTETSSMLKVNPTTINSYLKGPAMIDLLENLIGKDRFNTIHKQFIETWKWKHPTPHDFFNFINSKISEDINWFWNTCFFQQGYTDVGIESAVQNEDYIKVRLKNEGGIPVPFRLTVHFEDGTDFDEEFNIAVWQKNQRHYEVRIPTSKKVEHVSLDGKFAYDSDPSNDSYVIDRK